VTLVLSPPEIVKKLEIEGRLGLLDKHISWERCSLGELCTIQNGAPFESSLFNNMGLGMPLIRIRDISKNITETCYSGTFDDAFVVSPGDLLIGMDGDFRLARWMGAQGLLNQRVCRLMVSSQLVSKTFIELVVPGYLDAIWKETSATTVKHLSSRSISEIPIPLPPLDEQEKIVEILEEQLSRLDAALASVRTVRVNAARFRRSLLHAAFTGMLTGHVTSDGGMPPGWSNGSLGDFCEMYQPKTISTKELIEDGEFPVFGANGQIGFYDKYNHEDSEVTVTCRGASCGTVNVIPGKSWITGNAMVVRPINNCMSKPLLSYQLQSLDFAQVITGTAQPQITRTTLKEIKVVLPPLDEQSTIVQKLEEQLSRLDVALKISGAIEWKASAMRRSLLHAAFTGELTKDWREGTNV
jgi:type I restriction enzyme S subunit